MLRDSLNSTHPYTHANKWPSGTYALGVRRGQLWLNSLVQTKKNQWEVREEKKRIRNTGSHIVFP